jgi:hypothetical protein
LELINVLDNRRLERELRRREAALREAAEATKAAEPKPDSLVRQQEAAEMSRAAASKPQPLGAEHAQMTPRSWECDFCERVFYGYGQFLNHKCHGGD